MVGVKSVKAFVFIGAAVSALYGGIPECRMYVHGIHSCTPYPTRLLKATKLEKQHPPKRDAIVEKILPLPQKTETTPLLEPIEVVDVEEPKRYRGSQLVLPPQPEIEPIVQEENATHNIEEVPEKVAGVQADTTKEKLTHVEQTHVTPTERNGTRESNQTEQKHIQAKREPKTVDVNKTEESNQTVVKKAPPKPKKVLPKGEYVVRSGDTLSHIAWILGIKSKDIVKANHLKAKNHLRVGQKLTIPLSQERIDALVSGKYRVKSGDTLIGIAKKFSLSPKELKKFNHIKKSDHLRIGETLKLPLPYIVARIKAEEKRKREALARKKAKERKLLRRIGKHRLRVTATAYTSHGNQTDSTPFLAAWNNRLRPGMKIIAVSRDLLYKYGMKNGTPVRISGLPGVYRVRDKMNKRYKRRIDIYMGLNKRKALKWGRRSVVIYW